MRLAYQTRVSGASGHPRARALGAALIGACVCVWTNELHMHALPDMIPFNHIVVAILRKIGLIGLNG